MININQLIIFEQVLHIIILSENRKILREIDSSGFEVGLHFDKSIIKSLINAYDKKSLIKEIISQIPDLNIEKILLI